MTSSQLLPTISLPTKLNRHHNTIHGNIFTNQFNPDISSGNYTLQLSDYLASFLIIPHDNQQFLAKRHNILKRDTKNFNQENLITEINQIQWDNIINISKLDVNLSFNAFYDTVENILDRHMPNIYAKTSFIFITLH